MVFLIAGAASALGDQITVFEGTRKTYLTIHEMQGGSYLRVADLQNILGFQTNSIVGNQNLSLTAGDHNIILSANRALVSMDGSLISLSRAILVSENEWFVPIDFISKVLRGVSGKRFLWLENSKSLILGDAQPNQVQIRYSAETGFSRLVFQSIRPIEYAVFPEAGSVLVVPRGDDFVPGFQDTSYSDGVIQDVSVEVSGSKRAFRVNTGNSFASFRTTNLSDPPRLVIDFYRKGSGTEAPPQFETPPPVQTPPTLLPSTTAEAKVIVIDPGHGGTETGAQGPDGTFEKDVTMSIARKLKAIIESNTGMRVILTRDSDEVVSLDDRTARANNNKADLFVSIHANATLRGVARGAETYFLSAQATDDDARNTAAVENNAIGLSPEASAMNDELKLILWDMAQTEYLEESSRLAELIQQELNTTMGISNRGIKQAPFRVLTGATMPAVLVEVGFINNPEEEKLMKDGEYQLKIAGAIFRSVQAFQSETAGQTGRSEESSR